MPKGVAGALCGLLTAVLVSAASADGRGATALDRYVAAPEASYRYKLLSTETGDTYTANVLAELRRFDSSWLGFTDQVAHAAVAWQYALDQTFYLDIEAMAEPANSSG
ncbi:MAG TPA: Kdo hydroxylase family protein [Stellaceae bacterium]|nr:Kdo hydroxylase family protein [Stellaceae bacterium]